VGDQLKLPTIAKESLVIKTFGNDEIYRKETCEKVKFTVGDIGGHFATKMEAYVVPDICAPISNQEIDRAKRCYAHLKKIDLADSNHGNEEMEIQLLIGVDYIGPFSPAKLREERTRLVQWRAKQVLDGYYRVQFQLRRNKNCLT
jgi:hypothetical protein